VSERYFMSTDDSGHWYIIPVTKRQEWEEWSDLPEEDERTWEAPDFARPVGGSPTCVTFTDPA